MPHWTDPVLSQSSENIYELYSKRGFNVDIFLMDREFECLREIMTGTLDLNTTAAAKHVTEIEQQIQLLKERARVI